MEQEKSIREKGLKFFWVFHRLLALNFISFLVFWPLLSWFYILIYSNLQADLGQAAVWDIFPGFYVFASLFGLLNPLVFYLLSALSAVLFGPFVLGLHFMTGKLVMGQAVWVSDFFLKIRLHFLQGVALGLLCILGLHMFLWNLFLDLPGVSLPLGLILSASRVVSLLLVFFFLLLVPYFLQMLVFTDLPVKAALSNARILSKAYFLRGALALSIILLLWFLVLSIVPILTLFVVPSILIALTVFLQAWVAHPIVRKKVAGEEG